MSNFQHQNDAKILNLPSTFVAHICCKLTIYSYDEAKVGGKFNISHINDILFSQFEISKKFEAQSFQNFTFVFS